MTLNRVHRNYWSWTGLCPMYSKRQTAEVHFALAPFCYTTCQTECQTPVPKAGFSPPYISPHIRCAFHKVGSRQPHSMRPKSA